MRPSLSAPPGPGANPAPIRQRGFGSVGYVPLVLGIAMLLGIVATSVWLASANRSGIGSVVREQTVLATIREFGVVIDEAETGQRGYLLTGKDSYLAPFIAAREKLQPALAALEAHGAQNRLAAARVTGLKAAVSDKFDEMDATLELTRRGDREAALALVRTDRGEHDSAVIRTILEEMDQAEQAVIAGTYASIIERGRVLVAMDAAGLAGLVLLAAFIVYGVRRYVTDLRGVQAEIEVANSRLEANNVDLERTVQIRTADLLEANEEIQRFAYIVSHDLRAPLVNIMGFTSELESAADALSTFVREVGARQPEALAPDVAAAANEDIPEAIRFIKASTAKMDRLISAILRLSREGRRVLTPERLDMRDVLAGIIDAVRHQALERGAEIRVEDVPALTQDRLAVEQIFGNLIDNALKYLKQGRPGLVTVKGYQEGAAAVFEVHDNGRGIAKRDHDRIFDLFRRAGDQTVPGEGIGLAHVRALVRRLGGTIACQSVLDEGTVFRLRLPAATHSVRSLAA